jgi:hypothetical protein
MYDLHNLGWNSFQQLYLTITSQPAADAEPTVENSSLHAVIQ